jgi:hypothetical protein
MKMRKNINRWISFGSALLLLFAVTHGSTAWAQPKTPPQTLEKPVGIPDSITDDISLDRLKAKRTAVEGAEGLDAANKKTC